MQGSWAWDLEGCTSLLVNRQHRNVSASTPSGHLSGLIYETLKVGLGAAPFSCRQDTTQMLGHSIETRHISSNIFGRSMVIVENRGNLVGDQIPPLADANVKGEDTMEHREHEGVELVSREAADTESRALGTGHDAGRIGWLREGVLFGGALGDKCSSRVVAAEVTNLQYPPPLLCREQCVAMFLISPIGLAVLA